MSYHVYQGPAVIQILPVGFFYGYVYWRCKKLWPLVLAHALIDIISLNPRP
jgi:membrane protease YdiL (CAAX protease family)